MAEEMYWQQGDTRAYPALRGRRTADAVIIGGGLTGLTVALWLCRAGLRVILVDDVRTTGATAKSCVRTLRDAGAERVILLTATIAAHRASRAKG